MAGAGGPPDDDDTPTTAITSYRGIWPDEDTYIREQIAEHLPPFLAWLPACCDPTRLRGAYTAGKLRVWSRPAPGGRGVHVFESVDE